MWHQNKSYSLATVQYNADYEKVGLSLIEHNLVSKRNVLGLHLRKLKVVCCIKNERSLSVFSIDH